MKALAGLLPVLLAATFFACSRPTEDVVCSPCEPDSLLWTAKAGLSWTTRMAGKDSGLQCVVWTGSAYGTVGDSGVMFTSDDGSGWTFRSLPTNLALSSLAFVGGKWIVMNDSYEEPGWVDASADAVTWDAISSVTYNIKASLSAGGRLVAVGNDWGRTADAVNVSADGIHWTRALLPGYHRMTGLAWSGSLFVAGGAALQTSTDGMSWTVADSGQAFMRAVAYGQGKFVAVGENGSVASSPDGKTWTAGSRTGRDLNAVVYTGRRWIAAGLNGTILVSDDGASWTSVPSGTTRTLRSLAVGKAAVIAVGDSSTILSSP